MGPELTGISDERLVAEVGSAFGLGAPAEIEPMTTGFMNRNWRLTTPQGAFAVKHLLDSTPDHARRQHAVTMALGERGFPVPRQVHLPDGDTVLDHACGSFVMSHWVGGVLRDGADLDLATCRAVGRLLGELHEHLVAILPVVPPLPADAHAVPDPAAARDAIDRYLALIDTRAARRDAFDERARELLRTRRELVTAEAGRRPITPCPLGPTGWKHGDFQSFNLVWDGDIVAAVLDWDRLRVGSLLGEVVRAAIFIFLDNESGHVDLERLAAFVAGYRTVRPADPSHLADAVLRWWWNHLCGLWPLDRHYDKDDPTCDRFFLANSALLAWWQGRHDEIVDAFVG